MSFIAPYSHTNNASPIPGSNHPVSRPITRFCADVGCDAFQDRTLLEGLEQWFNTEQSINKLKKMLWGWEALRVFNDKLSSSLSQIQRAQEAMEHVIKQVSSRLALPISDRSFAPPREPDH